MKLILATNNAHKVKEIRAIVGPDHEIQTLAEAGIRREIPEPYETLRENALTKAQTIHLVSNGRNCFSEDTGLEVDSLGGLPGVHSARYAGEPVSSERNTDKLLAALANSQEKSARFRTVVCLILANQEHFFEGVCEGRILSRRQGEGGFGYDAVFMPEGATVSFAEMDLREKNRFSHRRKAVKKMLVFLREFTLTS